jgi:hypothetical protein
MSRLTALLRGAQILKARRAARLGLHPALLTTNERLQSALDAIEFLEREVETLKQTVEALQHRTARVERVKTSNVF